jgi:hypothetical protein
MRFFQPSADIRFYAGVDLHARSLFSRHSLQTRVAGVRMRVGCGWSLASGPGVASAVDNQAGWPTDRLRP